MKELSATAQGALRRRPKDLGPTRGCIAAFDVKKFVMRGDQRGRRRPEKTREPHGSSIGIRTPGSGTTSTT
ncbi:hypothetical protein ACRAWF_24715 [Streptomyces sp. L7]